MKKDIKYGYYAVAFIDILGQKDVFNQLNNIEFDDKPETKDKIIQIDEDSAGFVEKLRQLYQKYFDLLTEVKPPSYEVSDGKKVIYDEVRKVHLKHYSFSDSIVAFVPLQSDKYCSPAINGVYGIFAACGGLLLIALAMGKVFRAGIDVGKGIELESGEVYGPALYNAHYLECRIAQYPRIVLGNELLNYLGSLSVKHKQASHQPQEDIELCKTMADCCLSMVELDIDGNPYLDYLGDNFKKRFDNYSSQEDITNYSDTVNKAIDFIEKQVIEKRKGRDSKLALRYHWLLNYFKGKTKR